MSVELDIDNVIEFERPLTRIVKKTVTITNPHSTPLAFKVKTTAPKVYCVRPNSEIIQPQQSLEVQIILQALKKEPEPDFRCKDKFLIQSILVDEQLEGLSLADLWSRVDEKFKSNVNEKKLRCNFVEPASSVPAPVAAPAPVPVAPAAAAATVPATGTTPVTQPTEKKTTVEPSSIDRSEELTNEKLRQMKAELEQLKSEAETLRNAEPVNNSNSFRQISMILLFALLAIAVAYFVQSGSSA